LSTEDVAVSMSGVLLQMTAPLENSCGEGGIVKPILH